MAAEHAEENSTLNTSQGAGAQVKAGLSKNPCGKLHESNVHSAVGTPISIPSFLALATSKCILPPFSDILDISRSHTHLTAPGAHQSGVRPPPSHVIIIREKQESCGLLLLFDTSGLKRLPSSTRVRHPLIYKWKL